jgi:hypothetical protein
MTLNRFVALLTPIVFAPAAGYAASWLAKHAPGVDIKQSDLQAIFIAGALIGLAPAAQWLHGWQKYEARQSDAEHAVELAVASGGNAPTVVAAGPEQDLADAAGSAADLDSLDDLTALGDVDEGDLDDDFDDALLSEDGEPVAIPS